MRREALVGILLVCLVLGIISPSLAQSSQFKVKIFVRGTDGALDNKIVKTDRGDYIGNLNYQSKIRPDSCAGDVENFEQREVGTISYLPSVITVTVEDTDRDGNLDDFCVHKIQIYKGGELIAWSEEEDISFGDNQPGRVSSYDFHVTAGQENPGFESGELNPWYSTRYSDPYEKCEWINIGVDREARYEGEYGAFIDIRCSREAWGRIIQEPVEITPGEKLAVEAKLMYEKDLNEGYAELWLVFLDEEQKYVDSVHKDYYKSDFGDEDKWITAVLPTTTAPSNAKYVRVMVGLANVKNCQLNIDNVIFKYVSAIGNHPPSAVRVEPVPKGVYIDVGDTITFRVKAEDEDEDVHNNLKMIKWFIDGNLRETDPVDGTSEEASFTYTFENRGMSSAKATVYDERMEEDSVTWEVNVGEEVGLKEEEILDKDGNEIGLKVRIEYPITLHLGKLGYIDIKLKTKDFEYATWPDGDTNLKSGRIMIASDEDMFVAGGEVFEIAPVPQLLHREAFGWKDYKKYLRQEKSEWGMKALKRIFAGLPVSSQLMWLQETLNWNPLGEIKYDIGREPMHVAFYSKNNYDIWEYPWTFDLFSICKDSDGRRGNGVHLRMPFVYEEAGKHEIVVFLHIEDYDSYGFLPSGTTIGKEYKCDIYVSE